MTGFALGPAGAGRLGITAGFERSPHTPGPALRRRMTAAAGPAGGSCSEPLRAEIEPGCAGDGCAADALDTYIPGCCTVRVSRALPANVLDAEGKVRSTGAVRVADTFNAVAVLFVADLAGVAVDHIDIVPFGPRL